MKRGLLLSGLSACAGVALARESSSGGAIHPFAKYKELAVADAANAAATTSAPNSTATQSALECFQVAEPVLTPSGVTRRDLSKPPPAFALANQTPMGADEEEEEEEEFESCSVVLMERVFENSYGAPYIGMH